MASFFPIISLTTDFGLNDGYVGAMQGVILKICPSAQIAHLTHYIPPQDIDRCAFILYQTFEYYPKHAVHCVVVDPGVGSERRAVAIDTSHGTFVGPDNGVFSLVLDAVTVKDAVTLTNPKYQLPNPSHTFHGRDIFAPAAAHIAAGVPLNELGDSVSELRRMAVEQPAAEGESRIIHVDYFGNLVLDMTRPDIVDPETVVFTAGQEKIHSLSRTFADVPEGELVAYIGSTRDHVEIAIRNGNAAQALDLQQGDVVQVSG